MQRDEMRKRLEELAKSAPPKDLSSGAMCYEMATPPERAEYVCPACGDKTLYATGRQPDTKGPTGLLRWLGRLLGAVTEPESQEPRPGDEAPGTGKSRDPVGLDLVSLVEWGIPDYRRQLQESGAAAAGVRLDESQFCERCRPGVAEPKLALVVPYEGEGGTHRVEGVSEEDVQLVCELFKGEGKHNQGATGEVPLKEHTRRLAELLGVPDPCAKGRRDAT